MNRPLRDKDVVMNHYALMQRAAFANIRKTPGFLIAVVLSLGITMGTLLVAVSLNNLIFVKALPYPDHQSLFVAEGVVLDKGEEAYRGLHTYPAMLLLYKSQKVFSDAAIMRYDNDFIQSLPDQPKVDLTFVSPEFFALTGENLAIGRGFDNREAIDQALPVAVISYVTWQQRFNGRSDILTEKIQLGDISYQIIGVTASTFTEPALHSIERRSEVWLPWDFFTQDEQVKNDWINFNDKFRLIGKLRTGISVEQADSELSQLLDPVFKERTAGQGYFKTINVNLALKSFNAIILGSSKSTALMLLFGVLVIVFIACANICNLFLSRVAEKQRQMAIQATLGAEQKHLFHSVLIETGILVGLAFIFSIIIAVLEMLILKKYAVDFLPRVNELSLDVLSVATIFTFSVAITIIFSVISIKTINYRQLRMLLQSSGKGVGAQVSGRVRSILIASQVILAVLMMTASMSLMFESQKVLNQDRGVNVNNVYELSIDSGIQKLSKERRLEYLREIENALQNLDSVKSVSASAVSAVSRSMWATSLSLSQDKSDSLKPNTTLIDERFFAISGISIVNGSNFTPADIQNRAQVVIVNQALANLLAPNNNVLGKTVFWADNTDPYRVIGVVSDTQVPGQEGQPRLYVPGSSALNFLIELREGSTLSKVTVINLMKSIHSQFKVSKYLDTQVVINQMLFSDRLTAYLSLVLTAITFFLATIGIYGVISFGIRLRRYELGIRMSVGATTQRILIHVFKDYVVPVTLGLIIACSIIFAMMRQTDMLFSALHLGWPSLLITAVLVVTAVLITCQIGLVKIIAAKPIFLLRNQTN